MLNGPAVKWSDAFDVNCRAASSPRISTKQYWSVMLWNLELFKSMQRLREGLITFLSRAYETVVSGRKESPTASKWWPKPRARWSTCPLSRTRWARSLRPSLVDDVADPSSCKTYIIVVVFQEELLSLHTCSRQFHILKSMIAVWSVGQLFGRIGMDCESDL